jgi:hypothetical protein
VLYDSPSTFDVAVDVEDDAALVVHGMLDNNCWCRGGKCCKIIERVGV